MVLAIKAPPEEGGTCRRAGARKGGGTRQGLGGKGPAGDLSPVTNSGSSPGHGRALCKVAIPHGAWSLVRGLCGSALPGVAVWQDGPDWAARLCEQGTRG